MKIFGVRFSLIGDMIMALPIKDALRVKYPGSELTWSVAKKCAQAAALFEGQHGISQVKVSDFDEDLGPTDYEIIGKCDLSFNVKPPHPAEQDWYNYRTCIQETAVQAGLDPALVSGRFPVLHRVPEYPFRFLRAIAIYPFAGYGRGLERSPSLEWWKKLTNTLLCEGYTIHHLGTENEPDIAEKSPYYSRYTQLPFIAQQNVALQCEMAIGTDSGSMWTLGAFQEIPQINLLTNWLPNHHQNPLALAPISPLATDIFAEGGCSNIPHSEVLTAIHDLTTR